MVKVHTSFSSNRAASRFPWDESPTAPEERCPQLSPRHCDVRDLDAFHADDMLLKQMLRSENSELYRTVDISVAVDLKHPEKTMRF